MNKFKRLVDIMIKLNDMEYYNIGAISSNKFIEAKENIKEFKNILNCIEVDEYAYALSELAKTGFSNILDYLLVYSNIINTSTDNRDLVYITAFETLYANNILEVISVMQETDIQRCDILSIFTYITESNIYVFDFILDNQIDNRINSCPTILSVAAALDYDGDIDFKSTIIKNINTKLKEVLNIILNKSSTSKEVKNISNSVSLVEEDNDLNIIGEFTNDAGQNIILKEIDDKEEDYKSLILNEVIVLATNLKLLELNGNKVEADYIYNNILNANIPKDLLKVINKLYRKPFTKQGVKMISMTSSSS